MVLEENIGGGKILFLDRREKRRPAIGLPDELFVASPNDDELAVGPGS